MLYAISAIRVDKKVTMPAVIVGPPQRNEQMWQALKTHITRERERKKQGKLKICNKVKHREIPSGRIVL